MKFNKTFKQIITEADQSDLLKQLIGDEEPEEKEEEEEVDTSQSDTAPDEPEEQVPDDGAVTPPEDSPEEDEESSDDSKDEEEDNEKEQKKKEDIEKQKIDDMRAQKFDEFASRVVMNLKIQLDQSSKQLLDDFSLYGTNETVAKYIESTFIPQLKDSDDKLFITLNMDDFVPIVSAKLGTKFLKREV